MIRPIVVFGDARLRNRPRTVTPDHQRLERHFADLLDTVAAHSGLGLAATQVAINLPLAVVRKVDTDIFFECVNLRIVERYGAWAPIEGCLSVAGAQQPRRRAKWIRVAFETPAGLTVDMEAEDVQEQWAIAAGHLTLEEWHRPIRNDWALQLRREDRWIRWNGSDIVMPFTRDDWTCVRCGFVGWADVDPDVLPIELNDKELLHVTSALMEQWAIAAGHLTLEEWHRPIRNDWALQLRREDRVRGAVAQLPESIRELYRREREQTRGRTYRQKQPGQHQLEVNHIQPVRTNVRVSGCWNHQSNLETLCRPCHVVETRLQIVSYRKGWAADGDSHHRTIACHEGLHDRCWTRTGAEWEHASCLCACHPWGIPALEQTRLEVSA